jgi:hypothetical protein
MCVNRKGFKKSRLKVQYWFIITQTTLNNSVQSTSVLDCINEYLNTDYLGIFNKRQFSVHQCTLTYEYIFKRLKNCGKQLLASSCVCLSVRMKQLCPQWIVFINLMFEYFFENLSRKLKLY